MRAMMKPRPTLLRDPAEMPLERLDEHPRYSAAREGLTAIERRIEQAEQRRRVALARNRGQLPTRSVSQRAEALVAGGSVQVMSPEAELQASDEELRILHAARMAKNEELQQLASEISQEVCAQFAQLNAEALRNALQAATDLHTALEVSRVIRGRLIGAGYTIAPSLPTHMFPAAAAVGDPSRVSMTPSAIFKAWLADKGII